MSLFPLQAFAKSLFSLCGLIMKSREVLGFFNRTKESRWRLDISPAVYAVGTSSDLMTKADNTPVADNLNDWHLGYGGQAQVSYAVADNMNIGLYGGFTHLTGKPMDGMPELHSTNFIIDAGVKFSFAFGGKKRTRQECCRSRACCGCSDCSDRAAERGGSGGCYPSWLRRWIVSLQ